MRLNPLWITFILIRVSSVRRRMWATGTPSQMSLPYFKAVSTLLSMSEVHSSLCCEQSGQPPAASFLKPQHDKLAIHASLPHISTSDLDFWLVEQQERLVLWTAMTLLTKIYCIHFQFNVSVLWAHDAYTAIRIYDTDMEIRPPVFKVMKCLDFFYLPLK